MFLEIITFLYDKGIKALASVDISIMLRGNVIKVVQYSKKKKKNRER